MARTLCFNFFLLDKDDYVGCDLVKETCESFCGHSYVLSLSLSLYLKDAYTMKECLN